jgi:prevent-host-death family protein
MRTIDAEEAREQFEEILAKVESGETIVITVDGIPVATLAPVEQRYKDAAAAIDDWVRYREGHNITLGGTVTIRELIEGDRDRHFGRITRNESDEDDRSK